MNKIKIISCILCGILIIGSVNVHAAATHSSDNVSYTVYEKRIAQTEGQFNLEPNVLETEQQVVTPRTPLSLGASACAASGCVGSACFFSACIGSACTQSGCVGSGCASSLCGGSICIGSACYQSSCAASCK